MSPGKLIRTLLGARLSRVAGRAYRAVFVDLAKANIAIASEIPLHAHVLDVGGGDGVPLNLLLDRRPDIRVTTIDPGDVVGQWIDRKHEARVIRLPKTDIARYLASNRPAPDVILLSDVVHHIPPKDRPLLFREIASNLATQPRARLIVKDVEPGHWRAWLGYLSDRYVSGDRDVAPVSRVELRELVGAAFGLLDVRETELFGIDPPNYAVVFSRSAALDPGVPEGRS